ncbi:hypothetical protein E1263_30580 [Kribbella antibiotica]|uniref:DUF3040 domain-containing protein n=2 Tax=Kribbella antibiotica TaxID=190195 RepID=A0A4R4YZB4_9ACTN|nr:hypothetical protein E1263_30580 [Kribbella antibiotica]
MTVHPDEDPAATVERMHQALLAQPDNNELRVDLAWAIRRMTEASLALTIYEVRLIASEQQRAMCREAAARILELAPWDDELRTFANGLAAEVESGGQWVWQSRSTAIALAVCAIVVGLGLVVTGGLTGDVVIIVIAGVVSSAALAGIVLAFRRQSWQVAARAAAPVIQYAGI